MEQPGPGRTIACVGAVVRDHAGRLLLVRRRHDPGAGLWSVPGGKVEPGEGLHDAVVREVAEETGLEVVVGRWVGRVERAAPHGATFVIDDHVCEPVEAGAPVRAASDATDVGWFTDAEVEALPCVPGLREALREWDLLGGTAGSAG